MKMKMKWCLLFEDFLQPLFISRKMHFQNFILVSRLNSLNVISSRLFEATARMHEVIVDDQEGVFFKRQWSS